ncbi:MAG: 4'-phosphopantetheinyl transferase superfamily protein [Lentimicrobiaceae bacterium]|nr:4'-phosphopantetheinyl transferase superfamily protein [Lentimicrobiaceae bacterium]
MIILKEQISQSVSIVVWQIEETEEFFFNSLILSSEDQENISKINLQQLRLQKLACRAALADLLGSRQIEITYSETGQPQLKGHSISFSHTKNCVAVALANAPVGIDIEELSPRISKLYPRFMSEEEMSDCDLNNLQDLYYYWCAKEAMYKWFSKKNLDFIADLRVCKKEDKGEVCKMYNLQLKSFNIEHHIISVCY